MATANSNNHPAAENPAVMEVPIEMGIINMAPFLDQNVGTIGKAVYGMLAAHNFNVSTRYIINELGGRRQGVIEALHELDELGYIRLDHNNLHEEISLNATLFSPYPGEEEMDETERRKNAEERRQKRVTRFLAREMAFECPDMMKPNYRDGISRFSSIAVQAIIEAYEEAGIIDTASEKLSHRGGRGDISPSKRLRIYERDGYACLECGTNADLTVDHIYPVIHGGTNDMHNLRTLCRSCNARKGATIKETK